MNDKYISDILSLDVAQRIELAQILWDSISQSPENIQLSQDQKNLLDIRLKSYEETPDSGVSWSNLKKSIIDK